MTNIGTNVLMTDSALETKQKEEKKSLRVLKQYPISMDILVDKST